MGFGIWLKNLGVFDFRYLEESTIHITRSSNVVIFNVESYMLREPVIYVLADFVR